MNEEELQEMREADVDAENHYQIFNYFNIYQLLINF
jgi:hypothetical protein